ncbi:MAG: adenosylcobinamide-GDP ribazoletransferase [Bacteroidota bacterium]|nr:adenosylcobinamide-GDP ribazoletransferase [Bacteroidota bacterium]
MLKRELNILLTAIMFYTRIPMPKNIEYSSDMLNKATRYFPFIGYLVGGLGSLVFIAANEILSIDVAVVGSLAAMVLLTGAFHEDAFADFCDGFGGGYSRKKILSIMKDSRIGTYGAVGLCLLVLFKFVLLRELDLVIFPVIIISAHVLSRVIVVILIYTSKYIGSTEVSKSKPVGDKKPVETLIISMLWITPLFYFLENKTILYILPVQLILLVYFRYYIHKKTGGYTGDVLGTLQQLSELLFYVSFLIYTALS